MDLAVLCDLRIASTTTTFSHPEYAFGDVVYGPLRDIVGGGLARELCLTGRVLDASARRWPPASSARSSSPTTCVPRALELAERIAVAPAGQPDAHQGQGGGPVRPRLGHRHARPLTGRPRGRIIAPRFCVHFGTQPNCTRSRSQGQPESAPAPASRQRASRARPEHQAQVGAPTQRDPLGPQDPVPEQVGQRAQGQEHRPGVHAEQPRPESPRHVTGVAETDEQRRQVVDGVGRESSATPVMASRASGASRLHEPGHEVARHHQRATRAATAATSAAVATGTLRHGKRASHRDEHHVGSQRDEPAGQPDRRTEREAEQQRRHDCTADGERPGVGRARCRRRAAGPGGCAGTGTSRPSSPPGWAGPGGRRRRPR